MRWSNSKTVQAAYADLRSRQGFRVIGNTIDTDSATPRACVQFSEPLVKSGVDYTPFVTLDGAAPKALEAKDDQICVEGLTHGQRYKLVAARRPALLGRRSRWKRRSISTSTSRIAPPTVRFTGDNFVLPQTARRGIPLVSVNTTSANLKLYRIGDRNIAPLLTSSQFLTQLDGYSAAAHRRTNPANSSGRARSTSSPNSTRTSSPASRSTRRCRSASPASMC